MMYHFPGNQWAAATATTAATAHGRIFDFPFHIPTSKAVKTAVNAKSSPHCAGLFINAPIVCPITVELTHAIKRIMPLPSKNAASRPPAANSPIVSSQLSSTRKKTATEAFHGGNHENHGSS